VEGEHFETGILQNVKAASVVACNVLAVGQMMGEPNGPNRTPE
jgi:hypothetical protein